MSSHYAKPENALRKARDLVKVKKESTAIKTLHTILTTKRYRTWSATHEKIMVLYLELSVGLRRPVKDALVQYRMICQAAQASSLERVLKQYQLLAEEKAKNALASTINQEQSNAAELTAEQVIAIENRVVSGMEDLEEETPSDLLVQAAQAVESDEKKKSRDNRQSVIPWIKYLWDAYRTIMEVLRNNGKLEPLYHAVARAAFSFCYRFRRSMEFRRLCDILRHHLFQIARYQSQQNAVDLNNAETQKFYLETRFEQLKTAADLELWQEAYRTIADIYENMKQTQREPKAELMKTYYEKLAQIFWASENYLFHAYSLNRFYILSAAQQDNNEEKSSLSVDDRKRLASSVLLSSLIIPASEHDISDDVFAGEHEANSKLAELLGFKRETPTRTKLLQSIIFPTPASVSSSLSASSSILGDVSDAVKKIYTLLEEPNTPLNLYESIRPALEEISKDQALLPYLNAIEQLVILRVMQQLSSIYRSVKFSKLFTLLPHLDRHHIERLIMHFMNTNQLSLRIDHVKELVVFTEESLESQRMRDQLVLLSKSLGTVSKLVRRPDPIEKQKERANVFGLIQSALISEHEKVFERQSEIEKRKLEWERLMIEKERREAELKEKLILEKKEQEAKRLAEETARREAERLRKEEEERLEKQRIQLAALKKAEEEREAKRRVEDMRRRELWKRIDYTVRACRIEERELLIESHEKQRIEEADSFEEDFKKFLTEENAKHQRLLKEKTRLQRTAVMRDEFFSKIMERRKREYDEQKHDQDQRARQNAISRILAERRRRAEEERRAEAERRRVEEEERKKKIEEEIRLEKERKRAEERRRADEIAEKQRQRELEIEERERKERDSRSSKGRDPRIDRERETPRDRRPDANDRNEKDFNNLRRPDDRPRDEPRNRVDDRQDIRRRDDDRDNIRRDDRDRREFNRDRSDDRDRRSDRPQEKDGGVWRRGGGDRDGPSSNDRRDDRPPRAGFEDRDRNREDRPSRLFHRNTPRDEEGGKWRKDENNNNNNTPSESAETAAPSDSSSSGPLSDRSSRFHRDDREPSRRDDRREDRRGGDRGDDRPSRRGGDDGPRRGDDRRGPRDGPRRGGGDRDDRGGDRDWRDGPRRGDAPKEGGRFNNRDDNPRRADDKPSDRDNNRGDDNNNAEDDEGFTKVGRNKRK